MKTFLLRNPILGFNKRNSVFGLFKGAQEPDEKSDSIVGNGDPFQVKWKERIRNSLYESIPKLMGFSQSNR